MYKTDLHLHTTASDGSKTPTEVIKWAKNKGLEVVALTDHDTVDGVDEGRAESEKEGIRFVSGIELSTFSTIEIHVLGYNLNYKDADFTAALQRTKDFRVERNVQLGERLQELGVKPDMDFEAKGLGRMNIAREMVKQGLVKDTDTAFDDYLGANGRAYNPTKRLSPLEAVKMITSAGGFAVIAHPKKLMMLQLLEPLVVGLKNYGLKGLECHYPGHSIVDVNTLLALCKRNSLLPTGGSDFHDDDKNMDYRMEDATAKALGIK